MNRLALTLPPWMAAAVLDGWRRLRRYLPKRRRGPGLNTIDDAEAFIATLRLEPLEHQRPTDLASRLRVLGDLPPVPPGVDGYPVGQRVLTVTLNRTESAPTLALTLDMRTPIWDELERDRRRRIEALRMPTQEMRTVFDALTAEWRCSWCTAGDCDPCPGCSCGCKLAAVTA